MAKKTNFRRVKTDPKDVQSVVNKAIFQGKTGIPEVFVGEPAHPLIDDKAYRMEVALKILKTQFDRAMRFVETGNVHECPDIAKEIEIDAETEKKFTPSEFDRKNKDVLLKNLKLNLKCVKKIKAKKKCECCK